MKTKNSVQGARLGLESLGYVKQRNEPNLKSALFSKAESKPASAQKKSPKPVVDVEKAKRTLCGEMYFCFKQRTLGKSETIRQPEHQLIVVNLTRT